MPMWRLPGGWIQPLGGNAHRSTQLLHTEQCEQRGGRYTLHVSQYLLFTMCPLTITSCSRGKWRGASGGSGCRGMMPGSDMDVRSCVGCVCERERGRKVSRVCSRGGAPSGFCAPHVSDKCARIDCVRMLQGLGAYTSPCGATPAAPRTSPHVHPASTAAERRCRELGSDKRTSIYKHHTGNAIPTIRKPCVRCEPHA